MFVGGAFRFLRIVREHKHLFGLSRPNNSVVRKKRAGTVTSINKDTGGRSSTRLEDIETLIKTCASNTKRKSKRKFIIMGTNLIFNCRIWICGFALS